MTGFDRVRRRFRVDNLDDVEDGILEISGGPLRHLEVLRAAAGDTVYVFDGRGKEFEVEVVEIGSAAARLALGSEVITEVESPLRCCLVQAIPVRSPRMDTIVRQTTEIGVDRIVPVFAERSQRPKGQAKGAVGKVERWRRIADAAAEQSRRRVVPKIDAPCDFADLAWPTLPQPLLIADLSGPGDAGSSAASELRGSVAAATVLIGPEGGWSEGERQIAGAHGARPLGLGPRVLRADTAGVVALAILQQRFGDLG